MKQLDEKEIQELEDKYNPVMNEGFESYVPLPLIIGAKQFSKEEFNFSGELPPGVTIDMGGLFYLKTQDGSQQINSLDWILVNHRGDRFKCSDELFRNTYTPLEAYRKMIDANNLAAAKHILQDQNKGDDGTTAAQTRQN
jgi:hypothetical protein